MAGRGLGRATDERQCRSSGYDNIGRRPGRLGDLRVDLRQHPQPPFPIESTTFPATSGKPARGLMVGFVVVDVECLLNDVPLIGSKAHRKLVLGHPPNVDGTR